MARPIVLVAVGGRPLSGLVCLATSRSWLVLPCPPAAAARFCLARGSIFLFNKNIAMPLLVLAATAVSGGALVLSTAQTIVCGV